MLGGGEDGFWAKDDHFRFIAVEFKKVVVHPGFDVGEAVCELGENGRSNGSGSDIKLGIVGVTVKVETMVADDVT